MSITQISRIQIRRGLEENLPQLAGAELAWTVDTRKLFVGNGTTEEGAPRIGNTEILTEHSDILSLNTAYTFKGERAGYTVTTGVAAAQPITRSWNDKFDDHANIRDFGAIGDGITDETDSFNRAINQLYKESVLNTEPRTRRTLYVPAGTYKITGDSINVLPYVKLKGDGKNATFIIQTDTATSNVPAVLASKAATFTSGSSSTTVAGYFEVEDLTLQTTNGVGNVVTLGDSVDVLFNRVRLKGAVANLLTVSAASCVRLENAVNSSAFLFTNCDFSDCSYGFYARNNLKNANFINCTFSKLYSGVVLGDTYAGGAQCDSIKVSHSVFTDVSIYGMYGSATGLGARHLVSAFNKYNNVGYNQTNLTPFCEAVRLGGDNCYSIGDAFDKSYTIDVPAIQLLGTASYATLPNGKYLLGKLHTIGGSEIILLDGTMANTSAGVIGFKDYPTIVEYSIMRGTDRRVGTLHITPSTTTIMYSDDYVETNDTGIVLTPEMAVDGSIELKYVSSLSYNHALLKVSSRTLTGLNTLTPLPIPPMPTGITASVITPPGAPTGVSVILEPISIFPSMSPTNIIATVLPVLDPQSNTPTNVLATFI